MLTRVDVATGDDATTLLGALLRSMPLLFTGQDAPGEAWLVTEVPRALVVNVARAALGADAKLEFSEYDRDDGSTGERG